MSYHTAGWFLSLSMSKSLWSEMLFAMFDCIVTWYTSNRYSQHIFGVAV